MVVAQRDPVGSNGFDRFAFTAYGIANVLMNEFSVIFGDAFLWIALLSKISYVV